MIFPLSLSTVSLWLAAAAIILLITSELLVTLPEFWGRLRIERRRFRLAALGCGLAFLVTVVMRLFQPF
ncbi:MAG: hypothetical protein R3319_05060 [Candidatus Bathyarchaeia archaeon]|nr:hypothetical protein [Candidatus Bathyarchaeia archaeon]